MATDVILRNVKLRLLRKITLRRNYAHLERNYDVIDSLARLLVSIKRISTRADRTPTLATSSGHATTRY